MKRRAGLIFAVGFGMLVLAPALAARGATHVVAVRVASGGDAVSMKFDVGADETIEVSRTAKGAHGERLKATGVVALRDDEALWEVALELSDAEGSRLKYKSRLKLQTGERATVVDCGVYTVEIAVDAGFGGTTPSPWRTKFPDNALMRFMLLRGGKVASVCRFASELNNQVDISMRGSSGLWRAQGLPSATEKGFSLQYGFEHPGPAHRHQGTFSDMAAGERRVEKGDGHALEIVMEGALKTPAPAAPPPSAAAGQDAPGASKTALRLRASVVEKYPYYHKINETLTLPAFSPDGNLILYGRRDGRYVRRRTSDLAAVGRADLGPYASYARWLDDERIQVVGSEIQTWSADLKTALETWSEPDFSVKGGESQIAPDKLLSYDSGSTGTGGDVPGSMQVRDFKGALLGHKIFAPPSGPEWDCIDAHLTPDGRYALVREFARKRGGHGLKDVERIAVYSIPGFEPVSEVLGQKMVWPVISPDGRLFVTLIREHDSKGLMVYALPGLKRVGFAPYPASLPLAFSPDGRYLAIAREPQESPGMKILDAERHWAVVFSTTAAVNGAVFSPDGRALLTTEREPHESPLTQIFRLWDFSP